MVSIGLGYVPECEEGQEIIPTPEIRRNSYVLKCKLCGKEVPYKKAVFTETGEHPLSEVYVYCSKACMVADTL